jgi:ATP-binding cassette subfamily C protein
MKFLDYFKNNRRKTPTILQMEAVECGSASLGICLGYFGKFVPLEELRVVCGVSRDGSNAFNIIEGAKKYGLEANGYKVEIDEIKDMPLPLIVFWNFNHFIIVEGFAKKFVYINDPASGPRKISYEEFDKGFTGVVITVEPTENFVKSGKPESVLSLLKEKLSTTKSALMFIAIISLFLVVPELAIPGITQIFFDKIVINRNFEWAFWVSLSLFICTLFVLFLHLFRQKVLNRLHTKLSVTQSAQFLWHLLRLPIEFYSQRYSGENANRLSIVDQVAAVLTGPLATTSISVLLVIFYLAMMLSYSIPITLIALIAALVNLLVLFLINRSRNDAYARMQQEFGKSIGYSIGCLQSIESIKAAGTELEAFGNWAGYYTKQLNAQREINLKDIILITAPPFLMGIATAALLGVGAWQIIEGNLTSGMLIALNSLSLSFFSPVTDLLNLGSTLQTTKVNVKRLDDVLKNKLDSLVVSEEKKEKTSFNSQTTKLDGYLELRDVTFGYCPLNPPLIENLSIKLNPGQRVALVGPSGCGKSTISKLISGVYQPWSGQILFDGKVITDIPRNVLENSFSTVDQSLFLFAGTIKDNLVLWNETIKTKDIINAAKDAEIHEAIVDRPKGYDTVLNEGGANLSGGEGQRLEIARALINSPHILVMDEATSSLDSRSEETISKNIRKRGCTCVMVAHRLSTIKECDEIIVLDKGKVIQRGSHESLMNVEGVYKSLVEKEMFLKASENEH